MKNISNIYTLQKRYVLAALIVLLSGFSLIAQTQHHEGRKHSMQIKEFSLNGPYYFEQPITTDSVNAKGEKLTPDYIFNYIPDKEAGKSFTSEVLPQDDKRFTAGSLIFYLNHQNFYKGKIKISGAKKYRIYIDGNENKRGGEVKLTPLHHKVEIKFIVPPGEKDSIKVVLEGNDGISVTTSKKHSFNLNDMLYGKRISSGQISPDGNYVIVSYSDTDKKGSVKRTSVLKEIKSGKIVAEKNSMRWMPKSPCYLVEERNQGKRQLFKVNPQTSETLLWADNLPDGSITISPSEDYIILSNSEDGIKEDPDVYEIITPDDRQPGWRRRSYLTIYDIASGISRRVTFGSNSSFLVDIAKDGKKFIMGVKREQIQKRPHTTTDYLIVDAHTLKTDTLFIGEDFLSSLRFSPDGKKVLAKGSPEVFGRIGCILKENQTPSMYDMQLYIVDLQSKNITPITKEFTPSIENYVWNESDGQIYTSVTEGEYKYLY